MKAVKIACVAIVVLWMTWISLEIEQTKKIAYEACALSAGTSVPVPAGAIPVPLICPELANNELGPKKPR